MNIHRFVESRSSNPLDLVQRPFDLLLWSISLEIKMRPTS